MFDAMESIAYLSRIALKKKDLRFKNLYKLVTRKEFLLHAYDSIEGNRGSKTAGIDKITKVNLTNENKHDMIEMLSSSLYDNSYRPLPVRRIEIPKSNGKKRPLGIPALKDRAVQSAVKIILEAIYEPLFLESSHGFRPKRSCQTAISKIVCRKFDWVVEGDIKGCFDNIKHGKLLNLLRKRIADEKFINLIAKFLKSGYQLSFGTDGRYPIYETSKGTPQGGIISPILANVYLHEFDKFLTPMCKKMDDNKNRNSKPYQYYNNKVVRLARALKEGRTSYNIFVKDDIADDNSKDKRIQLRNRQEMVDMLRKLKKIRKNLNTRTNENYHSNKSLGYVRYADDFVILMGNYQKKDAVELKRKVMSWFTSELDLELSPEKTMITHSTKGFSFLGYDIVQIPSGNGIGYGRFAKVYVPKVKFKAVIEKMEKILKIYSVGIPDIIVSLNRLISGWSNYFRIANNWSTISSKLDRILYWKIMHWIGRKYKCQIPQVIKKHVRNNVTAYGTTNQKIIANNEYKTYILRKFSDFKYVTSNEIANKVMKIAYEPWFRTPDNGTIEKSIGILNSGHSVEFKAELVETEGEFCSKCGKSEGKFQVHHTKMIKRGKRKDIQARRQASKDIPKVYLCATCHKDIHSKAGTIKG
ncbi:reverse transcriptase domain-containing protein [Priestia sp. YIM B13551]|uniref:reverse transcriptase domain-containing protein n=1 Tax=Priestia sp. YIM B13551 TaxID=3366306 RepID=UPI00366F5B28